MNLKPYAGDEQLLTLFFKPENLNVLLIGAGSAGLAALSTILDNAPATAVKVVDAEISEAMEMLVRENDNIAVERRSFDITDLDGKDLVIVTVADKQEIQKIRNAAKENNIPVSIPGSPELSDFFLDPKAQQENTHSSLDKKIRELNDLSKVIASKQAMLEQGSKPAQKKWPRIVLFSLLAFFFMIVGHVLLSYIPLQHVEQAIEAIPGIITTRAFLIMLLIGFLAQMSDGSLGMGYGTIATTFLLAYGVTPALVSSQVHSARVFSSGVSGYSHHRFGNINKKLFSTLVIPGVIGAAIGAACAYFGQKYSIYIRVPLSLYTIYLGYFIIKKAFGKKNLKDKVKKAGWLASAGGFMDAFAGGGWGTLVTSTLMAKRKSPRYVIGSVCLAEFFVVLTSSVTFFILLKHIPILEIAGLIVGGLIAAPIAARLVGKLPMKTMFILVGSLVIVTSINTLWKAVLIAWAAL